MAGPSSLSITTLAAAARAACIPSCQPWALQYLVEQPPTNQYMRPAQSFVGLVISDSASSNITLAAAAAAVSAVLRNSAISAFVSRFRQHHHRHVHEASHIITASRLAQVPVPTVRLTITLPETLTSVENLGAGIPDVKSASAISLIT